MSSLDQIKCQYLVPETLNLGPEPEPKAQNLVSCETFARGQSQGEEGGFRVFGACPRLSVSRRQTLEVYQSVKWVVVKIMVPFWVPIIIRHLILRVPKKGP